MQVTTVSDFRNNIKEFMDATWDNSDYLVVARPKGKNVVVMSEQEFNSWKETLYLLSSKANAEALYQGMKDLEEGKFVVKSIDELDAML
jgi:antitoxin YefM